MFLSCSSIYQWFVVTSFRILGHYYKQLKKTVMKTKTRIFFILAIFFVAIKIADATDTPKMSIKTLSHETALLAFDSKTPTQFELSICNQNNEIVYFFKTKKKEQVYREEFDFSNFEKGVYNVCVNYGNKSVNRKLTLTKNGIETGPTEMFYEPYFLIEGNQLNVSFLNVPQKPVYLNVYLNNKHVSGLKLGKELSIQKCIDFSNLKEGEYQVVLNDYFKDHTFTFRK